MRTKEYIAQVEAELERRLAHAKCPEETVYEAARYSVSAGGKRLRPLILLMCAEMLGVETEKAVPFAAAMEMIHTYSLIHDDLPAMDNDDLRRGKPTCHKVYGEATAILAGDALLNLAAETVTDASVGVDPSAAMAAAHEIFTASGMRGMIGGQIIDIESEGTRISGETLKRLHLMKTGALLRAAGRCACALAAANEAVYDAVTGFCDNLGIAFQIEDDLLDVYGSAQELGKNTGSDEANGKVTYVTLYGKEESERMVTEYTKRAEACLEMFGDAAQPLKELAQKLTKRRV